MIHLSKTHLKFKCHAFGYLNGPMGGPHNSSQKSIRSQKRRPLRAPTGRAFSPRNCPQFAQEEIETGAIGLLNETLYSVKSIPIRQALSQAVGLGMTIASALTLWTAIMCIAGCESPAVVVLTGSMEPGFSKGDMLILYMNKDPIRAGEIVVFNVDGRDIPIVHRVIKVHEQRDTGEVHVLTKGDNNPVDDIGLYTQGQNWLQRPHIVGRAVGFLPYLGWVTIIMNEKPIIKYVLVGALVLLVITSNDKRSDL